MRERTVQTRRVTGEITVFTGSAHPEFAEEMCAELGVELSHTRTSRFSNDCLQVQLRANCRRRDVYIVQSLVPPVQENLFELLMMLDAARGASAAHITAVIPHFAYARSDKKDAPRISIGARLVADMLATAGATRVLTMALHAPQVHGFFSVPVDHLDAISVLADHSVVIDRIVGDVHDRDVIVLDDEIATAGSIVELLRKLRADGVREISLACTHGLYTGPAIERLKQEPGIREIVATNTVPLPDHKRLPNMVSRSVAPLFAEAVRRIHLGESVSSLFSDEKTYG